MSYLLQVSVRVGAMHQWSDAGVILSGEDKYNKAMLWKKPEYAWVKLNFDACFIRP
jgi:hypothetical protein